MNTATAKLTIVIGFRDRELNRLKLCLDSLATQTNKHFIVHIVDYGSSNAVADQAASLAGQYGFCKYLYTDTRGYPWNRSHCLNIGLVRSQTEYTMTSDMDMIYAPNFAETLLKHSSAERVIYFHPTWLKRHEAIPRQIELSRADQSKAHRGMFAAATSVLHKLQGFDEYYRYWGLEDFDLALRFKKIGVHEYWLNEHEETYILHQWHEESGFHGDGLPREVWEHLYLYYLEKKENPFMKHQDDWGKAITTEERPVMEYLDFKTNSIIRNSNLTYLQIPPDTYWSIGRFSNLFDEAASGQAIAVDNCRFGQKNARYSKAVSGLNRMITKLNPNVRFDYAQNALHSYLALFVIAARNRISDYYLGFPAANGVSVIIKK